MKRILIYSLCALTLWSCGSTENGDKPAESQKTTTPKVDEGKGVGQTTHVELNDPLDQAMIKKGEAIYDLKCSSCHKLTDKRVVGPGWAGLSKKRKPEWIMNMITNVDMMLEEDAEAQKLLEECLTRMPNQNVSVEDARAIVEFIYYNDQQQSS